MKPARTGSHYGYPLLMVMHLLRKLIQKLKSIRITAAMVRTFTFELIRAFFIGVFLYAAFMKLRDVEKFIVQLNQSPMLMAFSPIVARVVPATEIVVAAMLLFPRTMLAGLVASFTLMSAFTMYIVVILTYAERIPCSCGGILEDMTWVQHLIFNIVLMALAVVDIAWLEKQQKANAFITSKLNYA